MPELPEVESVRRSLSPHVEGVGVLGVTVRRQDVCESWRWQGEELVHAPTTPRRLLAGGRIERVERLGKQLAIIATDGRAACVHLGMTGRLRWTDERGLTRARHVHVVWRLEAGFMFFQDSRRFGGVWTFPSMGALERARWDALGPDALTLTAAALGRGLAGSTRPVKAALLDQSVAAGIGNIYADEALHRAGVDPRRRASSLGRAEVGALARAVRLVLRRAIEAGGSTIRDYADARGKGGGFQHRHAVYGRRGKTCLTCGTPLRDARVAQRMTVWCPACQH